MTKRKARVLIVDDKKESAEMMTCILASYGFDVQLAFSGKFALAKLHLSDFDLVVTNLKMHGVDAVELVQKVREFKPDQRIILITDCSIRRSQKVVYEAGGFEYIVKPFSPDYFLAVVSKSLNRSEERL